MDIAETSNFPLVVIIGGGFGGLEVAKALKDKPVNVLMLDKHNYHGFWPLLYQVAMGSLECESIAFSLRKKFDGQKSYLGRKSLDVHPEMKDSELFKVERHVLKSGKTIVKNAFKVDRFDHKTGEKRDCWFDFIYTPVFAEDGGVDGIAFFGFDVTDLIKG
ncbi:MAG: hypothetical protein EOP54_17695, partial [Sphingobacteriales bacterium]